MQRTERKGYYKNGDAVVSTDNAALAAYKKQRSRLNNINNLEAQIENLKVVVEELQHRVNKLEGK